MTLVDEVKTLIETQIPGVSATVSGMRCGHDEDHLTVEVVGEAFKDKALLEQHQMVMDVLRDTLKERLHAVKIKTKVS